MLAFAAPHPKHTRLESLLPRRDRGPTGLGDASQHGTHQGGSVPSGFPQWGGHTKFSHEGCPHGIRNPDRHPGEEHHGPPPPMILRVRGVQTRVHSASTGALRLAVFSYAAQASELLQLAQPLAR